MKVVYLNTWFYKREQEINQFLTEHAEDTDVFCLQELYDDTRNISASVLEGFTEVYEYAFGFETEETADGVEDFAQATYVKKTHQPLQSEILLDKERVRGLGIDVAISYKGIPVHILNYHGVSVPKDKLDSDDRLKQSRDLTDYYSKIDGPKILGGDFNFLPTTESYSVIKNSGYGELVIDSGIKTTRNRLFWGNRPQKHLHSDYIFVSDDIQVKNFSVPEIEISDHLPLILEFDIRTGS